MQQRPFGRRRRPFLLDLAAALLGALLASSLLPTIARAYVDPSVVTYTIQAVAGVAVALGAVLGVALRRTRRLLFRIFKIDENANKVVDPEAHPLEVGEGSAFEEADERARSIRLTLDQGRPARPLPWPHRLARALLGCGFTVATVLVFTPLEVVAASSQSLFFGFFDVTGLVVGAGVAIALLSALLVSLVRGRSFDVVLTVIVALGICSYVQALFLNASLPLADGQGLDLSDYLPITALSAAVWAAIVAGLLVLDARRRPYCRAFVLAIGAALLIVQTVSVVGIAQGESSEGAPGGGSVAVGDYGIDEVGAEGNVTVFVLDMFDTALLDRVMADDPAILDEYTGFTWFRNSSGSHIPTAWAIPYLVTGVQAEPGEDYDAYLERRDHGNALIPDIEDQGYEITMYSDSLPLEAMEPHAANLSHESHRRIDGGELWPILARVALYRDAPWVAKPLFWFWTAELNGTVEDSYQMDDPAYAERLRSEGLKVSESADRTYRFIHLVGAHWPYVMDREGSRLEVAADDPLEQAEGALLIVADYLAELRRLGLYDRSTVIVTADHGEWTLPDGPLEDPSSPILLVKPAETPEEAARPLEVSEVETGHLDLPATIVAAMGGDSSAYGPTVFEVGGESRDRPYWMTTYDGEDYTWLQYVIRGDVLDMADWHLTGNVIETTDAR